MSNLETIVSISTPMGTGALSVIRCTGKSVPIENSAPLSKSITVKPQVKTPQANQSAAEFQKTLKKGDQFIIGGKKYTFKG